MFIWFILKDRLFNKRFEFRRCRSGGMDIQITLILSYIFVGIMPLYVINLDVSLFINSSFTFLVVLNDVLYRSEWMNSKKKIIIEYIYIYIYIYIWQLSKCWSRLIKLNYALVWDVKSLFFGLNMHNCIYCIVLIFEFTFIHYLVGRRLKDWKIKIYNLLHFVLIFEFILIYLIYVLFTLKVEDNFRKRKSQPKKTKIDYYLYI